MSSLDKAEKLGVPADAVKQGDHVAASATMAHEAFTDAKDQAFSKLLQPGSACILDPKGYIECGPIVGYPPPKPTSSDVPSPNVPSDPSGTGPKLWEIHPELKKFFPDNPGQPIPEARPSFHYDPRTEKFVPGKDPDIEHQFSTEMIDKSHLKK